MARGVRLTRRMQLEDVADVARLEADVFPEPWSEKAFIEEVKRPDRRYLVVEGSAGDIIGYGGLMLVEEDAHITTLAVTPEHRNRGLGSRLLAELIEEGLAAGARHMTLEVRMSNDPARRLYSRFGFAPIGVRKNYYRDEDALIMWVLDAAGSEYRQRLDEIERSLP